MGATLYLGWESNPHFRRNWILNPARLPIPPPRLILIVRTNLNTISHCPQFFFANSFLPIGRQQIKNVPAKIKN